MENQFSNLTDLKKIPTGIEGFEHVSIGGLPEGRTTLVVGTSGSCKTLFAVELLYKGIKKFGRNGVFVSFEERPRQVARNVRSFGWKLDEAVENNQLVFIDASPETSVQQEVGDYDFTGLLAQIEHAVKKVDAKILVLDSIGNLFQQYQDVNLIRQEIFRISEILGKLNVVTVMTAERLTEYGLISKHGIEEFVSDNVIVLRNVLIFEKCRRTLQVLKMRGDVHYKGEFPFTISDSGISILPLSAMELKQESSTERVSTGNVQLDEMTNGGIFRDTIFLVSGPTGSGKTLMATMFAADSCRHGEKVLVLAYEESREQLLRNAQSWGMDFQKWERDGLLKIICQYPEAHGLEDHLLTIRREIDAFQPRRLVMDSISAMERVADIRTFREFVIGLTSYAKQERICSIFTSTTPNLSGGESITEAHISTITDAIILLRYVEINCDLRRGIAVIKMRGSQHQKKVREYTIDGNGLNIGKPFDRVQNIILGVPSVLGSSEADQLGQMFEEK